MPMKTFTAQYENHEIKVINTWFHGCTLYIDEEEKAKNNDFFALRGTVPLLTATIEVDGNDRLIEVYVRALLFVRVKICADGIFIGGDDF